MNQQPRNLHEIHLGPPHIYDSCAVWSTCGTPKRGAGAVPNNLTGSWEPIPHTGLTCPALIQGAVLSLTET